MLRVAALRHTDSPWWVSGPQAEQRYTLTHVCVCAVKGHAGEVKGLRVNPCSHTALNTDTLVNTLRLAAAFEHAKARSKDNISGANARPLLTSRRKGGKRWGGRRGGRRRTGVEEAGPLGDRRSLPRFVEAPNSC